MLKTELINVYIIQLIQIHDPWGLVLVLMAMHTTKLESGTIRHTYNIISHSICTNHVIVIRFGSAHTQTEYTT